MGVVIYKEHDIKDGHFPRGRTASGPVTSVRVQALVFSLTFVEAGYRHLVPIEDVIQKKKCVRQRHTRASSRSSSSRDFRPELDLSTSDIVLDFFCLVYHQQLRYPSTLLCFFLFSCKIFCELF